MNLGDRSSILFHLTRITLVPLCLSLSLSCFSPPSSFLTSLPQYPLSFSLTFSFVLPSFLYSLSLAISLFSSLFQYLCLSFRLLLISFFVSSFLSSSLTCTLPCLYSQAYEGVHSYMPFYPWQSITGTFSVRYVPLVKCIFLHAPILTLRTS